MTMNRRNSFDGAASRRRCLAFRRRILDISQQVTALHVAPAFSCLEMVDVIYHGLMRAEPGSAGMPRFADGFVMSKGHGCLAQYVMLEEFGILSRGDIAAYCKPDGRLGAHPDYGVPGIEASTGSLGHGLGIAAGMACAEKIKGTDRRTFVVISDGELQEGSSWEAFMMAANLGLANLTAFVDLNDFSGLERMSEGHPAFYPVVDKLRAFQWEAIEVNGHDAEAVFDAVSNAKRDRPVVIVGRTVKGKGVSYMEHVPIWHYRSPNKEEYARAIAELKEIGS
jgi:transketolase